MKTHLSVKQPRPLQTESLVRWFDLTNYKKAFHFITIYDSNLDAFRKEDLERLSKESTVFGFPSNDTQIIEALAA